MTGALILETPVYPRRCATESVGFEEGACGDRARGRSCGGGNDDLGWADGPVKWVALAVSSLAVSTSTYISYTGHRIQVPGALVSRPLSNCQRQQRQMVPKRSSRPAPPDTSKTTCIYTLYLWRPRRCTTEEAVHYCLQRQRDGAFPGR